MLVEFGKAMAILLGLTLIALGIGFGIACLLLGTGPVVGLLVSLGIAMAFGWFFANPLADRWIDR